MVAGVANREPPGIHLYRARVANGAWSLPVAMQTNTDGSKVAVGHVHEVSTVNRHRISGMCMAVTP